MRIKKLLFSALLLFSFCHLSSAETLKEYADKCTAEIGVAVPAFNCQTFEVSQGEGSSFGSGPCNFPNRLNRKCDPGSRIKILHNDPNVSIVASCRKDTENPDINDPFYNDVAVIQQNKKNGATCFYQALGHNDGSVVPSPSSTPVSGAAFTWKSPFDTQAINCVACHDNGAFIRSPYMANAGNFPVQNIGGSTITSNSDGDPYWFVGADFQNHEWKTYSVFVKNNACLSCHRLSVSTTDGSLNSGDIVIQNFGTTNSIENGGHFHRSSAMDFSLIATAGKEFSKSPHSATSPIWMPAGSTLFNATFANAAKEISDCAHQFDVNNQPNSDSCRITPHPRPILNIHFPLTTDTENAGDRTNPGKIWVHVAPPAGALPDVGQYTVKVAGVTANIVSGSQVGDEFWMVVEPVANNAAIPTAGLYDLDVTVKVPGSLDQSDKETKAVYLGDPGVPLDFAIVGDVSGSMSSNGKLAAAQNAARLYVDHASTGDKIAVVKFANSATVDLVLTDVNTTSLSNARTAINNWGASGQTAMGSGILRAAEQFNLSGNPQHQKRMALLTDGNENVWPYWADGPNGNVQFMVNAQDSIIDVVTLGDDADVVLAQDIANTTHGHYFRVDPSANVSLASNQSTNKSSFIAQLNNGLKGFNILSETSRSLKPGFVATSQTANTITLPNILANVYKSMAEDARKESRIGDWNGQVSAVGEGDTYEITLESGLPEVLFAVNWNLPSEKMNILFDKLGCGRFGGQQIIDSTHMQCRIPKPTPGKWTLNVYKSSGTQTTNYKVMVSAYSRMELMPYLPKREFVSGQTLPLFAYVGTNKPAQQATVFVSVLMPNGTQAAKQLFDDGSHDDGKAGDGYFGSALKLSIAGTYTLDYTATGYTVEGVPFKRKARRSVLATPTRELPYALMAKETLFIGDKSKVNSKKAQVYSGRGFELGISATAVASAFNNGIAYLHSAANLKGNLTYSGSLVQESGAVIAGEVKQVEKIVPPGFDNFFIHYGGRDIYLDPSRTGTWTPGDYRDAYVGSQSILTLKGGTYRFRSLTVGTLANIKTVGGKEGPTVIYVEEQISIADKTRIESECISCLVFYTNSKGPIRIEANTQFRGSVVAPNGEVDVASKLGAYINVAAQNIKVEASAIINLTE